MDGKSDGATRQCHRRGGLAKGDAGAARQATERRIIEAARRLKLEL
jgi:hypothetical protein